MKPKFTPKPWHVEDGGFVDDREDTLFVYGPDNHGSPHVMVGVSHNSDESRIEADANIIAAAPEMYDMLIDAARLVHNAGDEQEEGSTQSGPAYWHSEAFLIEEIIAKARGES